ncbi:hypothetical protein QS306_09255 [Paraburkholderia bonniea]|uniref:hypothetical protein n=1 Tax=Paraburkholderia bonniea TaxID=2152891 RepID=UPI002572F6B9|nr:hypothetical protein [Paraburkholderia bonniea]WJF89309.1 hypothetical protein QS306_09255 [Paraburkholderia bonniea]WJF92625.1 hypothetical protein QS308_09265 [Paraburkholderia bonniea]
MIYNIQSVSSQEAQNINRGGVGDISIGLINGKKTEQIDVPEKSRWSTALKYGAFAGIGAVALGGLAVLSLATSFVEVPNENCNWGSDSASSNSSANSEGVNCEGITNYINDNAIPFVSQMVAVGATAFPLALFAANKFEKYCWTNKSEEVTPLLSMRSSVVAENSLYKNSNEIEGNKLNISQDEVIKNISDSSSKNDEVDERGDAVIFIDDESFDNEKKKSLSM